MRLRKNSEEHHCAKWDSCEENFKERARVRRQTSCQNSLPWGCNWFELRDSSQPLCHEENSQLETRAFNFTCPPSILTVYSISRPPFSFRSFVFCRTNRSTSFRLGTPAFSPVSVRASTSR